MVKLGQERSSSGLGHHLFRVNIASSNLARFTFVDDCTAKSLIRAREKFNSEFE